MEDHDSGRSNFTFKVSNYDLGHVFLLGKFQVFLGKRNPFFAALTTIAKPINDPNRNGNSGPGKIPVSK